MKKSTLKITTESAGTNITPVIKIVQPIAQFKPDLNNVDDDDPVDDLIRTFLHAPCMVEPHFLFRTYTHFPVPFEGTPTHWITTIAPINAKDHFDTFKNIVLSRMIPYEDHVSINRGEVAVIDKNLHGTRKAERIDTSVIKHSKIQEFFQWLDETEPATWEEQQPDPSAADINSAKYYGSLHPVDEPKKFPMETIRDYFELSLEQGERMNAFNNTPHNMLDTKVSSAAEAFEKAFDINKSPQGAEYWQKVISRIS